ncbi:DUF2714 domain-containing protein [Mycoplasma zalophi]|uniref:DUF2714 domain-containing protein n=1 Tax=Mycoplasma zalophi TaxID=191287 RepID=A0ABS6DPN3_9MOLU|nr:DUF2714 domain-containing protein [Mycoplasma zalophi]MBU4690940.1 DUF2714 domain-containing protein [Mycoplasma zalophi]MBU4692280.1 DUF2714 domain-containing protein [Mycoplasma zalophi]
MKLKINKKEPVQNKKNIDLFRDYKEIIKSQEFISFEQLSAEILIKMGLGFESNTYKEFVQKYKTALENKWDMLFKNFIISFNINLKFSSDVLSPLLINEEQSAHRTINFMSAEDDTLNNFLTLFNDELTKLIEKNFIVEIFPELAIFKSKETSNLKLLFSEKVVERL